MCNKQETPNSPPGWLQVILPFFAGIAHLHVVYFAAFRNVFPVIRGDFSDRSTDILMNEAYLLDRAVFIAYMIDLACCTFSAIPFSRCNSSKDIIQHHLPTLLLALPLDLPIWNGIRYLEPTLSILDLEIGDPIRNKFIQGCMLGTGFAYISSMNEVFMCFQRVEMSYLGVASFSGIPSMKHHFFTSRLIIGMELCYKLAFFWGMSLFACKGCVDVPTALYTFHKSNGNPVWSSLLSVLLSPLVLRGALFLAFSVVMYPSMGSRCLRKIKQFTREGREAKKTV
eukprot:scaffold24217_cov113-Cylindrotheca_fusiformis.AAC.2